MSKTEELHDLVDRLGEERAQQALSYVRRLLGDDPFPADTEALHPGQRTAPQLVAGSAFFSQPRADVEVLAGQQAVSRVTNFSELLGDFWPEDETAEEFVEAVRQWRREGGHA